MGNKTNDNLYIIKIDYQFKKNPNLKYRLDLTNTNSKYGTDMFEVFLSYRDNKHYLVSPNCQNYNLDIFTLIDNKKILSLKGHKSDIRSIKYMYNNYKNNEYLISADDFRQIIIWDINKDYEIVFIKYIRPEFINNCLMIFPHNEKDIYVVISSRSSYESNLAYTFISSLYSTEKQTRLSDSNYLTWYILSWFNKKDNQYYIIHLCFKRIAIFNLLKDKKYDIFIQEPESNHFSGFIYSKDDYDYLCCTSQNGFINIWDLFKKKIYKVINTYSRKLDIIILWNNKYIIGGDNNINKSLKIIDVEKGKIISSISGQHTDYIQCLKKINHPIYGESLLSGGCDKMIKLWSL